MPTEALSPSPWQGEGWGEGRSVPSEENVSSPKSPRRHPFLLDHAREMRHEPAPAEKRLWSKLRARQLGGLKFRRQEPIGTFIADFYCAELGLIVELDGATHFSRAEYDDKRTEWLNGRSYTVIRFANQDVFEHLDDVLNAILEMCASSKS